MIRKSNLEFRIFQHHLSQNKELFVLVEKILEKNNFQKNKIQKVKNDFHEHEKFMIKKFKELKGKFTLYITDELLTENAWSNIHENFFKNEVKEKSNIINFSS